MDQSTAISRGGDDALPWYVRAVIVVLVLVVLFVLGIDVLELLGAV